MEDEIAKILESIESDNEELIPLNIIVDYRNNVINKFYNKYLKFDANIQNLKDI